MDWHKHGNIGDSDVVEKLMGDAACCLINYKNSPIYSVVICDLGILAERFSGDVSWLKGRLFPVSSKIPIPSKPAILV